MPKNCWLQVKEQNCLPFQKKKYERIHRFVKTLQICKFRLLTSFLVICKSEQVVLFTAREFLNSSPSGEVFILYIFLKNKLKEEKKKKKNELNSLNKICFFCFLTLQHEYIDIAESCLHILPWINDNEEFQQELGLIKAIKCLVSFGVEVLPTQYRMCNDRCEYIQDVIQKNPQIALQSSTQGSAWYPHLSDQRKISTDLKEWKIFSRFVLVLKKNE